MRLSVAGFDLQTPKSLDHALALLHAEPRTPLAGTTDLYVDLNFGTLKPRRFLDIWGLDELRGISLRDDHLVLGALTSFTALIRSPLVQERLPMLVAAARLVGGVQIQNRGTLGGNLANASPAGDSLPVLAATDAVLVLRSAGGERRIPVTEFYVGYRKTVLRPDELIVAVEVPPVEGRQYFRKVGTRAALAISKLVMAGVRASTPRIAIGSVAPIVIRAWKTEAALGAGQNIDEAVRILHTEITPIDDLRSSADYRRQVAGNLLRQFWAL